MKHPILRTIKWVAIIYAIGHIVTDYPNESLPMRLLNGVMLTIASFYFIMYTLKIIEKILGIQEKPLK